MKIKRAEEFERNGMRVLQRCVLMGLSGMVRECSKGACKWIVDDASLEFKHADLIKFEELVASLGLDYEVVCWPTLHKLVGN